MDERLRLVLRGERRGLHAKRRAEAKKEKEKLLEILAEKQEGKLSALSEKELQRRIAALDAESAG